MAVTFKKVRRLAACTLDSPKAFVFGAIIFRISLEIAYGTLISVSFKYMGFSWAPTIIKYFESWIIYCILIFFIPKRLNRISDLFLVIIMFNIITPILTFYALADQSRSYLYIVLLGYFFVSVTRQGKFFRFPVIVEGRFISKSIVILGVMGISVWFFLSGGVRFFNLNLSKVYELRDMAGEVIRAGPMGYLNTWAYFVFGPALLTIALQKRSPLFFGLVLLLHLFWFGVSTHKIVLFAPTLVVSVWLWLRKTESLTWLPLSLTIVILACMYMFFVFDTVIPASLLVRRVFYTPTLLTFEYYEFFTNNQWIWWSNSKLSFGLLNYPYDLNPADLIGRWRGNEAHANNGFLASGYMHAGFSGVVLYGMLVGFLFRIIDSIAHKNIPKWAALGILIIPIYSLIISSDLPTALLTKGIGVAMVLTFLDRSKNKIKFKVLST